MSKTTVEERTLECADKARRSIPEDMKHGLSQHSNFACSICGAIPIVFHHIEEWSRNFSNDAEVLIPICDKCHRGIHGEGGLLFSKDELYEYKANPQKPNFLSDKLPLERKRAYAFFVGSNFVTHGEKALLFNLAQGRNLLTVNTSSGSLKLTILAGSQGNKVTYLIRDNELMIDTEHIWDMHYSRNSLKVWKVTGNRKNIFIDLYIKPDVIVIRRMETAFDGKPFRVYRFRKPQTRQIEKIRSMVKQCENRYRDLALQIDMQPQSGTTFNGMSVDILIRETRKEDLRMWLERELDKFGDEFNWNRSYYDWVLHQVLTESSIFSRNAFSSQSRFMQDTIIRLREKYAEEFRSLDGTVVEYDGMVMMDNYQF